MGIGPPMPQGGTDSLFPQGEMCCHGPHVTPPHLSTHQQQSLAAPSVNSVCLVKGCQLPSYAWHREQLEEVFSGAGVPWSQYQLPSSSVEKAMVELMGIE